MMWFGVQSPEWDKTPGARADPTQELRVIPPRSPEWDKTPGARAALRAAADLKAI